MYKLNATKGYKEKNEEILKHLEGRGWKIDSFGHAKKEFEDEMYRYKFQSNTIRKEVRAASGQWIRLKTFSYKTVVFV